MSGGAGARSVRAPAEESAPVRGRLAGATTRGVFWSAAEDAASKAVGAASTLVLARLLHRQEFGVAAYALTFTTLLEVLRSFGIGQALIFFPRDERRTQTAFWLIAANGLALGVLALIAAPLLAAFYRDPRATGVISALALYFPLLALGQLLDVELRKDLRFAVRFVPELTRSVVKAAVSVALAFAGAGYWSLVIAQIVGAAAWSAVLWLLVPWRPRLVFDREEAKKLFGYGKHMVAVALLVAIALRADQIVVGRFLGAAALGLYTIAFALPAFLFQATSGASQVLFPAYARLERDRARLRSAALRTLRLAATVFVPAGVGLALVAEPLVLVAFGARWRDAIPVLPWMGVWAAVTVLTQHFGDVYKALGNARVLSMLQAVTTVLTIPALVWVGVSGRGLVAIVIVLIAVRLVRAVLDLVVMRRLVGLEPVAALRTVAPALAATALMSGVVLIARSALPALPAAAELAVLVTMGAGVYVAAVAVLDRGLLPELRALSRAAIVGDRAAARLS
jgi:PST family polysaccharide transporter